MSRFGARSTEDSQRRRRWWRRVTSPRKASWVCRMELSTSIINVPWKPLFAVEVGRDRLDLLQSVMVPMVSPEQCWSPCPSPAGALRSNPWPASPVIIWSPIYLQTPSKSNLLDFWPLRHLIRVMRKHGLTNKKTNSKDKDNDKYI